MSFSVADLDAMFLATGEPITIGASTVNGVVRGVDARELEDQGTPVAIVAHVFEVSVRSGALAGLVHGATATIRGVSYKVDRVIKARDDSFTRFHAYPV